MPIPRADLQVETTAFGIPLMEWHQADLANMGITGTSGDHFVSLSTEDILMKGNTPSSSTVTDISRVQFTLPPSYVGGTDLTFRVTAVVDVVDDANQIDLSVYRVTSTSGAVGSDICATAIQTTTATATAYDFTITGATLEPGTIINLKMTTVNTDANGSNGIVTIGYTALLMQTRG